MKKLKYIKALSVLSVFFLIQPVSSWSQSVEYHLKALMVQKIAEYVEWQKEINDDNFTIAVLGESSFKGELESVTKNTRIKNLPVKVVYTNKIERAQNCHVLFVSASEKSRIKQIVDIYGDENILLIGDSPSLSGKGIHFNFYIENDNSIHFEVDLKALIKSGLKPDMHLLTIGKIVN